MKKSNNIQFRDEQRGKRRIRELPRLPELHPSRRAATLDRLQLDREDQHGAARDLRRPPARAVRQVGWDVELPLVALDHELHSFRPALDDLVGREGGRGATSIRGIENGAIWVLGGRAALIVALARGIDKRVVGAVSRAEDFVLCGASVNRVERLRTRLITAHHAHWLRCG